MGVNWLRIGANGLIGFATAGIAATALGNMGIVFQLGMLNAVFQGLLSLAVEMNAQSGAQRGQLSAFCVI